MEDEGHAARGVRQVHHLLDLRVAGRPVGRYASVNGRRIYLAGAELGPGEWAVEAEVLDVTGAATGAAAAATLRILEADRDEYRPADGGPGPGGFGPQCAGDAGLCREDSDCSGHGECR